MSKFTTIEPNLHGVGINQMHKSYGLTDQDRAKKKRIKRKKQRRGL